MMGDGGIHVFYRAVVGERIADPMTAPVATAKIAISVIDPAVEADGRAPISRMKDEYGTGLAPICRSPENTYPGRSRPTTGDPDVSLISPIPVPRRPQGTVFSECGLILFRQRRRDRNATRGSDGRRVGIRGGIGAALGIAARQSIQRRAPGGVDPACGLPIDRDTDQPVAGNLPRIDDIFAVSVPIGGGVMLMQDHGQRGGGFHCPTLCGTVGTAIHAIVQNQSEAVGPAEMQLARRKARIV